MDLNRFASFDAVNTELHTGINLIEASAGTGKTFAIAMLALRFVVEQGLPIEQLLIVTFTKAATEELKERIRARLAGAKRALDGLGENGDAVLASWIATLPIDKALAKQRLQLALLDIDRAGIFTIHGFCQRILSEHALESGQVFDAELSGNMHTIRQQIAADFWRLHVAAAEPHTAALLTAQYAKPDALLDRVGRLGDSVLVYPDDSDLAAALEALQDTMQKALEALPKIAERLRNELPSGCFKNEYSAAFEDRLRDLQAWLQSGETKGTPYLLQNSASVCLFSQQTLLDSLNGTKFKTSKTQTGEQRKQQYLDELNIDCAPFDALATCLNRLSVAFRCAFVHFIRRERDKKLRELNLLSFDDLIGRLAESLQGERAEWLQHTLRQRYKAALIDEFQDTDQQQWHIFSTLFSDGETYLYLIGDPKQAIYKFRGADIFSYFEAQRQANRHFTLGKNWRSQPLLVEAVNAFFMRHPKPFWFDELHFIEVQPGVSETRPEFLPPLQLWQLAPSETKDGFWSTAKNLIDSNYTAAQRHIQTNVVREILRLLRKPSGETSRVFEPSEVCVHPQDISILVRTNRTAREYQLALQAVGIAAVLNSVESVFATREACDLYALLQALAHPGDIALLKQALTLPWFDLDAQMLYSLGNDAAALDTWTLRVQDYHRLWQEKGVMAMLLEVLQRENVYVHLARYGNAERQIANIQHLLELLQQACIDEHLGITKTLDWLCAAIADAEHNNGDDRQLRLESDAQAVQIVTLHRSKGLEYPLVFCPDLWYRNDSLSEETELIECHENGYRIADLGSEQFEERRERALEEELAEDLRIVYVALTRAKYRCYLAWADVRSKERANASALAYLLFSDGGMDWRETLKDCDFAMQQRILQSLCTQSQGFEYRLLDASALSSFEKKWAEEVGQPLPLEALPRTQSLYTYWQMSSYTALSALSLHDAPELPEDKAQEHVVSFPFENADSREESINPRFEKGGTEGGLLLPKGVHTGNVVHELLETQDFLLLAAGGDLATARQQACLRYGLTLDEPKLLDALLQNTVLTPLSEDDAEFCLSNIPAKHCLKEMPFFLPMPRLGTDGINRILQNCPAFRPLQPKQLEGFLTGFIDLICCYKNRYFVIDYKTNSLYDYQAPQLITAMQEHNYGLQYWIYTLVLHRYLQNRLPDYDYQEHFGGVRYLFVRGMTPEQPMHGVYRDYPVFETLLELSELFGEER